MTDTDRTARDRQDKTPDTPAAPGADRPLSPPGLSLDIALYERTLEDADLSPAQKREILQALWSIVTEFVLLGFGVHPVHQAREVCGKHEPKSPKPAITAPDRVNLKHRKSVDTFTAATGSNPEPERQGVKK